MAMGNEHAVGLRELRHKTSEVLARVRHGETIDVTEYGRLVARIVPVEEREATPILDRLAAEGKVRRAARPGYRPRMRAGDGSDRLGEALAALRAEEPW
jgi:prevent-host-death family protein